MTEKKNGPGKPVDIADTLEKRRFKMKLPCVLTADAVNNMAHRIASRHAQLNIIREEKRAANEVFRGKIGELEDEIQKLSESINRGKEEREVPVQARLTRTNEIAFVRLDTGEVFDQRPATPDELQGGLFPDEEPEA